MFCPRQFGLLPPSSGGGGRNWPSPEPRARDLTKVEERETGEQRCASWRKDAETRGPDPVSGTATHV